MAIPIYTPEQMEVTRPNIASPTPLREEMAKDLAQSTKQLEQTQKQLGLVPAQTRTFAERGYRVGQKVILQDEVQQLIELQNNAVRDYARSAGFTDQLSTATAEQHLNNRLNNIRSELLRRGLEFNYRLEQMGVDRAKKAAFAKNLGSIAGMIAGGIVGGPAGIAVGGEIGERAGGGGYKESERRRQETYLD